MEQINPIAEQAYLTYEQMLDPNYPVVPPWRDVPDQVQQGWREVVLTVLREFKKGEK